MPYEPILREKARAAVQTGKLPCRRPDRTRGGPSIGVECAICAATITKGELEFEIEFASDWPGDHRFHVHIRCFIAWESERGKAQA